ncbi:MAG: pyruvate kinase [Nanoarchaeota archaeon]
MNNQAKIIEFLYKNSESSYNINQIARLLGISVGSSFKILKELEKNQYIASKKENKSILYRIVPNSKAKEFYEHVEQEKNSESRKKTKIICAISPSNNSGFIRKLLGSGMDAAIISASYHDEAGALNSIGSIRAASEEIPIILDLPKSFEDAGKWIKFALKNGLDFICVSFARNAEDVRKINNYLGYSDIKQVIGSRIKVIVRIEKDALKSYREIVQEAYGIMIDRDSLLAGKYEMLPVFQRAIIDECRKNGKPAIIATELLESMNNSPAPKNSEVSDAANAVLDGASCVMLSKSIIEGKFALEAIETMERVIKNVENEGIEGEYGKNERPENAIGDMAFGIGNELKIDAILTITSGGYSARMVSSKRLRCRIIAATSSKKVFRQLNILWGVEPLFIDANLEDISNEEKKEAMLKALKKGFIKKTDQIAIIASVFHSKSKRANLLEIHKVNEFLDYVQNKNKINAESERYV